MRRPGAVGRGNPAPHIPQLCPGDSAPPAQRAGQQESHPRPGALSASLLGSQRNVRLQPPLGAPAHIYNPSWKAVLVFTADQDPLPPQAQPPSWAPFQSGLKAALLRETKGF